MTTSTTLRQRSSIEELYTQSQYFTKQLPFQHFSDSLTEFVTILNKNRQIVFCNQPLVKYLNTVDTNDIIGKRPGEALRCQHSNNVSGGCGTTKFCKMCGANRAIQKSQEGEESIQECRITTNPESQALDLSVHATPITYNNEQFTIFALTDTSDEKRRKVLECLFFHDILNTVGGLMGYSELLKEATSEEAREFAPIINQLAADLNDQIASQRELMRAEHHETVTAPDIIHARTLLESLVLTIQKHTVASDKYIIVDPSAEDFIFISDEQILRRVLGNLLKNALEATAINSTVRISCKRNLSEVQFTVHNVEVIPNDIQLQIFQRSFSTKGEGRGLGTYSVKLFTEQYLCGKVSFVSNKDDGTSFMITLPATLAEPDYSLSNKRTSEDLHMVHISKNDM
ncbi:MAG: HAMP domain-containing sensor histidine kinase [Bacteriovoracaceae bacterium]|nr:HAMP domain-containing histidine kinase [Bacteroidota bacterium]